MLRRMATAVLVLLAAIGTLGAVFLWGMRTKHPTVQRAVRQFNKQVMNPQQLRSAGTPGSYAAIVRHVGRRSGAHYETPVGAVADGDTFVITLPYGTGADWVRNVLAAGGAVLVHEGETHDVDRPEVVSTDEVLGALPAEEERLLSIFDVTECLRLHRADRPEPEGGDPAGPDS